MGATWGRMARKTHTKAAEAVRVALERLQTVGLDMDVKLWVLVRGRKIKVGVADAPMIEMDAEE